MKGAWHEGYEAYPDLQLVDNPYKDGSQSALSWEEGWKARFFEEQQEEHRG